MGVSKESISKFFFADRFLIDLLIVLRNLLARLSTLYFSYQQTNKIQQ